MFTLDCSEFPTQASDFAFDQFPEGVTGHLADDLPQDIEDKTDFDYENQQLHLDVGDLKTTHTVRYALENLCRESVGDMLFDIQDGYEFEHSEQELERIRANATITINTND